MTLLDQCQTNYCNHSSFSILGNINFATHLFYSKPTKQALLNKSFLYSWLSSQNVEALLNGPLA